MNKINKKGFTIIEMILSFSFIMIISVGLFLSATNYKNKQQLESARRDLETFKMNIITDIHKRIDEKGLEKLEKVYSDNYPKERIYFDMYDGTTMQLRWGSKTFEIHFNSNDKMIYSLADSDMTKINSVELKSSPSSPSNNSKKANVYKITINIHHDKLGNYPINIVLSSFSSS